MLADVPYSCTWTYFDQSAQERSLDEIREKVAGCCERNQLPSLDRLAMY